MGDNLKVRKFIEDLGQVVNSSDLPIEVRRMAVELIHEKLTSVADKVIDGEMKELQKESEHE